MSAVTARAVEQLRRFLAVADPRTVTTAQAAALVEAFVELERLAAAGKILFAARAAESNVWADAGHRTASSWLADVAGSSLGDAVSAIETSRRLEELPGTSDALRAGGLSAAQVNHVAQAAGKDPTAERELLEVATTESMRTLKEHARRVMAQASSKEEEIARYRAIHDRRYLRHYTDSDGAFRLEARLTPDAGARILSAVQAKADALFQEARKSGDRQRPEAYGADALVELLSGSHRVRQPSTGRTDSVVIRVDAEALRRGWVEGAERCEIAGVGPVPVATARRLMPDAFVKLVIREGVDVLNVCHIGRGIPAHVQSALEERDPACVVPGCDVTAGLESHHYKEDYAVCGTTRLSDLARVCAHHHDLVTYGGYELTGRPGAWQLLPPAERFAFDDTG